jgi:hypothetical protein
MVLQDLQGFDSTIHFDLSKYVEKDRALPELPRGAQDLSVPHEPVLAQEQLTTPRLAQKAG